MTTYRNYNDACVSQSATKVSKRSRFLPTLDFSETENKQDTEAKITSFRCVSNNLVLSTLISLKKFGCYDRGSIAILSNI